MARPIKMKMSAEALKGELWETLRGLRQKKINATTANAIATQSREIIRVIATEISIAKLSGDKPNKKMLGNIKR